MFITQYTHRLPAGYDLGLMRKRAAGRGPYWDRYPGLIVKGFLISSSRRLRGHDFPRSSRLLVVA